MSTRTGRHVIFCGPDGSGKTTMAKYISTTTDTPMAPKISDSLNGVAGVDLARYVDGDMSRWVNYHSSNPQINRSAYSALTAYSGSMIYDRYPLISEPIYGQHVRHYMADGFLTPWYARKWEEFLEFDPLVVFCLPPYDEVVKYVSPDRDMPGVWRAISKLYPAYQIEAAKYPGTKMIYDYTTMGVGEVIDRVVRHIDC